MNKCIRKKQICRAAVRQSGKALKSVMEFVLDVPGMVIDFAIDHLWFQLLLAVLSAVAGSVLSIVLLTYLGLAGYIPLPWWL